MISRRPEIIKMISVIFANCGRSGALKSMLKPTAPIALVAWNRTRSLAISLAQESGKANAAVNR